ncbi:hypothetical protein Lser_V15G46018 [Lactuca serriola]
MSSSPVTQSICCPKCQEPVAVDGDVQIQSKPESGKFVSVNKGLHVCIGNMLHRHTHSSSSTIPNSLSSHEKSTLDTIRNWETIKGKRALLCAVTYDKQKYQLKGTNYDVIKMHEFLMTQFKFPSASIHILAEMDSHPHPTKRNIQEALRWLVKDNQHGDSLVFYFSGHGLRQPDFFDDENDGFDETICPLDFRTEGMIIDNEINDTIVRPLKKGVKLHAMIDACHSGTILDLPHVYSTKEHCWSENKPPSGAYKGTNGGLAISISACEDNQLAADTSAFSESGKQMEGAMTHTFRKAFSENSKATYANVLSSMHDNILAAKKKNFSISRLFHRERLQEPLLSSSEEFDLNEAFVL